MNELVKVVLSLSLSGALLILLLFVFRFLFKERLSKRWQYYIWLVVVARLLFPFAPETNLMAALFQGFDMIGGTTEQIEPVGIVPANQTDEVTDGQNNPHREQMKPSESVHRPVGNIAIAVWANLWPVSYIHLTLPTIYSV